MSNSIVPPVYKWIIDDVIEKMALHFAHLGIDESVLQELQAIWEQKVIASRVATFPEPAGYQSFVADGPDDDADHQYSGLYSSHSSMPSAANLAAIASATATFNDSDHTGVYGTNNSYRFNQTDGADDEITKDEIDVKLMTQLAKRRIAQRDGNDDSGDESEVDQHEDAQSLNSDLDDAEDDEGQNEETEHIILCQYEKVTRNKTKWKTVLKDGVINVNGKDYLFSKATGEFEW